MTTPTQDQLMQEFDDRFADLWLNDDNKCVTRDVWHWITTVYEPKVREEERQAFAKRLKESLYFISREAHEEQIDKLIKYYSHE